MSRRPASLYGWLGLVFTLFVLAPGGARASAQAEVARQIRFGTEMARQGNWREAIFRWQRALALDPANPRLHNNLAVAYESLGEFDKANEEYRTALAAGSAPSEIRENYDLFSKFYDRFKEGISGPARDEPAAVTHPDAKAP